MEINLTEFAKNILTGLGVLGLICATVRVYIAYRSVRP